jgi:hypothetical protein
MSLEIDYVAAGLRAVAAERLGVEWNFFAGAVSHLLSQT